MKRPIAKGGSKRTTSGDDDDDGALWSHAAQSIEPLKKRKPRFHPAAAGEGPRTAPTTAGAAPAPPQKAVKPAAAAPVAETKPKRPAAPPPIADFDRKKARKLKSGAVEIEARVDLHGMRQDEAHAALAAFLRRCHNAGKRWVLVITGKGRTAARDADDARFDLSSERERGVLRRNVPRWLNEPELRALVVSYAEASIAHGGGGALYIHLRSKHRADR